MTRDINCVKKKKKKNWAISSNASPVFDKRLRSVLVVTALLSSFYCTLHASAFPSCFRLLCLGSPLITSSSRCECKYNVEHVHLLSIAPPTPPLATVKDVCVCVRVCQSLHARREHTGCHRANICQGDLVCPSWRALTCARCQGQHAAVCRDKALCSLPSSCRLVFALHCALFLWQRRGNGRFVPSLDNGGFELPLPPQSGRWCERRSREGGRRAPARSRDRGSSTIPPSEADLLWDLLDLGRVRGALLFQKNHHLLSVLSWLKRHSTSSSLALLRSFPPSA